MPGDDLLAEFDSLAEESAPRMRQSRRTVLPEVRVEGTPEGTGSVRMRGRGRVELGEEVDANAPIAATDAATRGMLAGARGIGRAGARVASAAEDAAADSQDAAQSASLNPLTAPSRRRRVELRDEMEATASPVWDAILGALPGTGEAGQQAAARSQERARNWWDQFTSGQAEIGFEVPDVMPIPSRRGQAMPTAEARVPLGGRNSLDPIVGEDLRSGAPAAGFTNIVTFGTPDGARGTVAAALGGDYETARDEYRRREERTREQAPEAYAGGQVLGTLPLMAIPGASQASATIGLPARAALAFGQGMQFGGMSAFGNSDADLFENPEEVARDVVQGMTIGGVSNLLGEGVGRVLEGPGRTPQAREAAIRALSEGRDDALLAATTSAGRGQTAIRQFERGATPRAIRASRAQAAQTLRETGAVPTLGSVGDVAQGVDSALGRTTQVMDDVRSAMDGNGPTYAQVADALRQRSAQDRTVFGGPMRDVLEARADEFASRGSIPLDYDALTSEAARLRQMGAGQTRAGQTPTMQREGLDEIDSAMREAYDDAVEQQVSPAAREAYQRARRQYATLLRAGMNTGQGTAAAAGNRLLGFSEQVMGTGGAAAQGAEGGLMMAALANTVRRYEPTGRAAIADIMYRIARAHPERLGRYGPQLAEAASRGTAAFATTLNVLSQRDAEVRRLMTEFDQMEEPQQ